MQVRTHMKSRVTLPVFRSAALVGQFNWKWQRHQALQLLRRLDPCLRVALSSSQIALPLRTLSCQTVRTPATEFSGRSSPQSGSPESGGPKGRKRVRQVHRWKSTLRKERTNVRQQLPADFLQIQLAKLGEAAIVHEFT